MSSNEEIDFVENDFVKKSIDIFNQYYPMVFEKTKTLIIPTSNDLVNDYFYGKIDPNDHPSNYDAKQMKMNKDEIKDEIKQLIDKGNRLIKSTKNMSDIDKEKTIREGNEHIDKAKAMKIEMERSDKPWNKLANIQRNRERDTIMKLIDAFVSSDIGGVLIQSPKYNKRLEKFIENKCGKYLELKLFLNEFKQYIEICDCIYFHDTIGIYVIEVKSIEDLMPIPIEERKRITHEKRKQLSKNNPYEKAIFQLERMVISKKEAGSMSLLQQLYVLITGSRDIPQISAIICTPNAKLSDVQDKKYLDSRFHHFDLDILSSNDKFKQFWINELINCKTEVPFDLCYYRKFIATMANCSVGRELFGINNSLKIAKKITEHNIDPTIMKKRQYVSGEESQTIFLNAKQLQILNDTSKVKLIFGPPGTGKTLLVILAAIDAVKQENGKVIVFTREWLVEYMKRILELNGFDKNTIEVRDFIYGTGKLNENDYVFVDECSADEKNVQILLNIVKEIRNVKLFVAISGQGDIKELCSIEEQMMELLNNEMDYRIFQLTEILRGTKSIIHFWKKRFNQILLPKKLQMECGHSIDGENVDDCHDCRLMTSGEVMTKMVKRLKELLIKNEPKNIAIICRSGHEKRIIESRLKLVEIAFGSTIEQDNNYSLIAVELHNNTYSREWPFVIYVDLLPYYRQVSIISSSRAIAHLTFIERNVKQIRSKIRDKCDDNMMKTILSSFDIYTQFRNQIDLADDEDIMYYDLSIDIILFNYCPSQIKQLYPNIFDDCNTFDQFFDIIVNKKQWMLLLFVHKWGYFQSQDRRHEDKSIGLIIEYKQSTEWIEIYEIEEMRAECLINNAKIAIELINKFIQPKAQEMMEKVVTDNRQLFEVFNNSNGIDQFDLMALSIHQIILINCSQLQSRRKVEIDTKEMDHVISKLLLNLQLLANRQQVTVER